jgi:hypothetical protein
VRNLGHDDNPRVLRDGAVRLPQAQSHTSY